MYINDTKTECICQIKLPDHYERYYVHPALLNQMFSLASILKSDLDGKTAVTLGIASIGDIFFRKSRSHGKKTNEYVWVHAILEKSNPRSMILDFIMYNPDSGEPCLILKKCQLDEYASLPPASALYETWWPQKTLPSDKVNASSAIDNHVAILLIPGFESHSSVLVSFFDTSNSRCDLLKSSKLHPQTCDYK